MNKFDINKYIYCRLDKYVIKKRKEIYKYRE